MVEKRVAHELAGRSVPSVEAAQDENGGQVCSIYVQKVGDVSERAKTYWQLLTRVYIT
jgi:hypothetical protein